MRNHHHQKKKGGEGTGVFAESAPRERTGQKRTEGLQRKELRGEKKLPLVPSSGNIKKSEVTHRVDKGKKKKTTVREKKEGGGESLPPITEHAAK